MLQRARLYPDFFRTTGRRAGSVALMLLWKRRMKLNPLWAVLAPITAAGVVCLWPVAEDGAAQKTEPSPQTTSLSETPAIAEAAQPAEPARDVEMAMALEEKSVTAEIRGNGRDRIRISLTNTGAGPLKVTVRAGQLFENERNVMVAVHPADVTVPPRETKEVAVQAAATKSTNTMAELPYQLGYGMLPRVQSLLSHIQNRPELTAGTIQTAILALTDNLSLSAVAKFTLASAPIPSRFNTDPFRVETFEIMSALGLLREIGISDTTVVMTVDPQLKIEAMIDPMARAMAMRYYSIRTEQEWDFWRTELLNGEPATRHYALFGIARFYPAIALEMLPRWAREKRTNPVYRLSAVQALADTQRTEALPILRTLTTELGANTELGRAANGAADYLDYRLAQIVTNRPAVAFRASSHAQGGNF